MKKPSRFRVVPLFLFVGVVVTLTQSSTAQPPGSPAALEFLGSFETLSRLGFTPDGIAYSPEHRHLFISSATGGTTPGVFEVSVEGELVRRIPFPPGLNLTGSIGFSIKRVTSGPKIGHFFLAEFNSSPTIGVFEFDSDVNLVNRFTLTGSVDPGDGVAYNHFTQTLVIADADASELFEYTTDGQFIRSFPITPPSVGITFNIPTGTYFSVSNGPTITEFTLAGTLVRTFDISPFGVQHAVGIASGENKLFVADEGDPNDTGGVIYIFRSPGQH